MGEINWQDIISVDTPANVFSVDTPVFVLFGTIKGESLFPVNKIKNLRHSYSANFNEKTHFHAIQDRYGRHALPGRHRDR